MPRTLNLTGFQTGDSLSLSVSQGALTAGPVDVTSWGSGSGGDGGTISINVERTRMQCAPDSVRFTVDLSAATFDTQGPTAGEIYDARMHDLIYLWDFDDAATGDWTAPVNVLPAWKNRNVAKGPYVAHMYTSPGTYNPSVLVIEPSSGKTATATLTGDDAIVVADPDIVYGGTGPTTGSANTIVVNPVGDTTWTGEPTGAARVNADSIVNSVFDAYEGDGPKRILFKRGETFTLDYWALGQSDLLIGSYGPSSTPPTLNVPNVTQAEASSQQAAIRVFGSNSPTDLRFSGLKFLGDFDPTTEVDTVRASNDSIPFSTFVASNVHWMVSKCTFDGVSSALSLHGDPDNGKSLHLDDTVITNIFGAYTVYMSESNLASTSGVMTGCRVAQPSGAHDRDAAGNGSSASMLRWNSIRRIHLRGCDFYHSDFQRNLIRLNSGANADGALTNIHSCSGEAGAGFLTYAGDPLNGLNRIVASNVIIDGVIYVGGYSTYLFLQSGSTGMSIRNCLYIVPTTPKVARANNSKQIMFLFAEAAFDPALTEAAPVKVYNNTFIVLRSPSDNGSEQIQNFRIFETNGTFDEEVWENNIRHQPAYTPQVINTYAPLTTTALWTPRNTGVRLPESMGTLDGTHATPAADLADYKPGSGSTAIGGWTSGNVSYMDITLNARPEPPSIGAWEME